MNNNPTRKFVPSVVINTVTGVRTGRFTGTKPTFEEISREHFKAYTEADTRLVMEQQRRLDELA